MDQDISGPRVIEILQPYVRRWRGTIREIDEQQYFKLFGRLDRGPYRWANDEYNEAPAADWHGVNYNARAILVIPEHATANGLIHEIAHVFASKVKPDNADEFSFLGFEIALAMKAGLYREWSIGNDSYELGNGFSWGLSTAAGKARITREAFKQSFGNGTVQRKTMEPISIR